jgi:hypothetical protein
MEPPSANERPWEEGGLVFGACDLLRALAVLGLQLAGETDRFEWLARA